jgi:hypothetical protein
VPRARAGDEAGLPLCGGTANRGRVVRVGDTVVRPAGYSWPRPVPARYQAGLVSHNDVHPANVVVSGGGG